MDQMTCVEARRVARPCPELSELQSHACAAGREIHPGGMPNPRPGPVPRSQDPFLGTGNAARPALSVADGKRLPSFRLVVKMQEGVELLPPLG